MQKNLQTFSIYWEASIFVSDNGVLTVFCFLKTVCVLGHQDSDFASSFFTFECKKEVPANCFNIVTDKRHNQLSEPLVWPLPHIQKGQFSLTGRGEWYRRDKNTIQSCENKDFSILKHFSFISCSSLVHGSHTKNDIPMHLRSSFQMTKYSC